MCFYVLIYAMCKTFTRFCVYIFLARWLIELMFLSSFSLCITVQYISWVCISNQVDHTSLVSVLECCESAIIVQVFLSPWSNGTTNWLKRTIYHTRSEQANDLTRVRTHDHALDASTLTITPDIQNSIEIAKIQKAVGTIRPWAKKYLSIDRRLATLRDRYHRQIQMYINVQRYI
jgi:hypothetical protein